MRALDVIIIGAGSAGLSALREVKKRTQSFAPSDSDLARVERSIFAGIEATPS